MSGSFGRECCIFKSATAVAALTGFDPIQYLEHIDMFAL